MALHQEGGLHNGAPVAPVKMWEPISSPTLPHRPDERLLLSESAPVARDLVEPDVLRKIGKALAHCAESTH
jgi:hypothetical protein